MMRSPLLALGLALVAAECQRRAPDEPSPPPTEVPAVPPQPAARAVDGAVSAADVRLAASGARCVRRTPDAPPPAVPRGPAPGCPVDPEPDLPPSPVVSVSFPDVSGVSVEAELVRSEHDTMRGLMYRRAMPEEHGMLFDLRERDDHKFWMHNTCIPLDLIYVDEDGLIVGIVENAPTLDDSARGVGCPSRWVLEVNAGWCRRHGVTAGQRMTLP